MREGRKGKRSHPLAEIVRTVRFIANLIMFAVLLMLERTLLKHRYVGYYDWPNQSWSEYLVWRDLYYDRHMDNELWKKSLSPR